MLKIGLCVFVLVRFFKEKFSFRVVFKKWEDLVESDSGLF